MFTSLYSPIASAKLHSFVGFNRNLKDTQDKNGKKEEKPFSPTTAIGYNFDLSSGYGFSPQFGYIHTKQVTNDSYGDQKTHTFFFNWDLLVVSKLLNGLAYRVGVGNFIKRIHGKGGTVEIPNGAGTASAGRPGKKVSSYSNTFNFGLDYKLNLPEANWYSDLGARFELFVFRPLSKEYRSYALNVGLVWYY